MVGGGRGSTSRGCRTWWQRAARKRPECQSRQNGTSFLGLRPYNVSSELQSRAQEVQGEGCQAYPGERQQLCGAPWEGS